MSDTENLHPVPVASATSPARLFRIFISSPGDLGEERVICARVVDRLKAEFARAARLQAVLWEQEPLTADLDFQEQIPLPSQTDIVVLLLWSRLGYRLHSRFKGGRRRRSAHRHPLRVPRRHQRPPRPPRTRARRARLPQDRRAAQTQHHRS